MKVKTMNLHKLIFTENACYKTGNKIKISGIMVHSTGADNPWLKRYVGPDDGLLGKNQYNNHWNTHQPEGRMVCVHAFIGKLADGAVATYQTLPWDHQGWHAGGSANDTHIGFEICEDGLGDKTYFEKVYREAVDLCAYLCTQFGLTEENIICHSEGASMGIASAHSDVMHWFPCHGKSMDSFRSDVRKSIGAAVITGKPYPEQLTDDYYRVRKSWTDAGSQLGAYRHLSNAKSMADMNPGYTVFAETGVPIYTSEKNTASQKRIHKVVRGDTLWGIAGRYLGDGARYPEIKALNGLDSNVIYSGWQLIIPD